MFSLIITVLAVALVAVLAFVGLYYGSTVASEAAARARAATLVNQGEQIIAAARLYYIDNSSSPATLQELVDKGYLQSIPSPVGTAVAASSFSLISEAIAAEPPDWTWDSATQTLSLVRAIEKTGVCEQVNQLSFNSAKIQDAVDTRFRVQCYGAPQSAGYTLIWNANMPADTKTSGGEYALCQGTKNIGHIPSACGTDVAEGTPVTPVTPPVTATGFSPVDQLPGLADYPPGTWSGDPADGTCSPSAPTTTPTTPLQYVIYSPGEGLATLSMSLTLSVQNAVDYWSLGYTYGLNTSARVLIDGQEVYNRWLDTNVPVEIVTNPRLIAAGTHVVTVEINADFTLMDAISYTPLSWTAEVPPPNKRVCVKQFQNAIAVKPATTSTVPPAGQLDLSGSCTMDALPSMARIESWQYYCPAPGGYTWGDLAHTIQYSNIVIRGTKETLDGLNPYATSVGAVFADGAQRGTPGVTYSPTAYINGECAAQGNTTPYEAIRTEQPLGYSGIRVSDTELWIPSLTGQMVRGNQCVDGACYDFVNANKDLLYPKNLSLALLASSGFGFSSTITAHTLSNVACGINQGRSSPFNAYSPSCPLSYAWNDAQGKCVCQPSASVSCAPPNGGLPADATNTNPSVKCTLGYFGAGTNGTCVPSMGG